MKEKILISTALHGNVVEDNFIDAVKMVKDAGFDAYDLSLDLMSRNKDCRFNKENYLADAKELRAFADSIGIVCNQAHAPFPSSYTDDEKTEETFRYIVRSMEIASICGAKHIVIHPKKHLPYKTNEEELFNINIEFYKSLIPYAEKYNIKIALENMWERNTYLGQHSPIVASVCSNPYEFRRYLDNLPSKFFVACVDLGHIVLTNENITEFMKVLGHDRVKALHIHDNDIIADLHTLPFIGKIPFDEFINALKEIDYDGDFTFETIYYEQAFPKELKPYSLKLLNETGKYFVKKLYEK